MTAFSPCSTRCFASRPSGCRCCSIPQAPGIALRPAPAALKDCFGLLSLNPDTLRKYRIRLKEDEAADAGD